MNASTQSRFSVVEVSRPQPQIKTDDHESMIIEVGEHVQVAGWNSSGVVSATVVAGYGFHWVTFPTGERQHRPGYIVRRTDTGQIGFARSGKIWREGCRPCSIRLVS